MMVTTEDQLDAVFGALADPTSRSILARLTRGEATVAELVAPFEMSQPAISRHLKVLERAGLITRTRRATARLSHLRAEPLHDATEWLTEYREFWEETLRTARRSPRGAAGRRTPTDRPIPTWGAIRQEGARHDRAQGHRGTWRSAGTDRAGVRCAARPHLPGLHRTGPAWCSGWDRAAYTMTIDRFDLRDGGSWRYVAQRRRRQRVRLPWGVPRRALDRRHRADVRIRGRTRATSRWTPSSFEERRRHDDRSRRTPSSSRSRTATAWSTAGMADGMSQGYEQLDELLGRELKTGNDGGSVAQPNRPNTKEERPMQKISTCLWFDTQADEAANFYVSLFDDSEITSVERLDGTPSGDNVALVFFRLAGLEYMAINGGPQFPFTEAVSFHVSCKDQDEVDRRWSAAHRRRRGRPVRLAEGPVRPELADRARTARRAAQRPRPRSVAGRDAGDAADAEDRDQGDGGRGQRRLIERGDHRPWT